MGERSLHTREVAGSKPAAPIVTRLGGDPYPRPAPSCGALRCSANRPQLDAVSHLLPGGVGGQSRGIQPPRRRQAGAVGRATRPESRAKADFGAHPRATLWARVLGCTLVCRAVAPRFPKQRSSAWSAARRRSSAAPRAAPSARPDRSSPASAARRSPRNPPLRSRSPAPRCGWSLCCSWTSSATRRCPSPRPRGRTPAAGALLRPRPSDRRALRRHAGEVHRRCGDGRLGRPGRARGRRRASGARSAGAGRGGRRDGGVGRRADAVRSRRDRDRPGGGAGPAGRSARRRRPRERRGADAIGGGAGHGLRRRRHPGGHVAGRSPTRTRASTPSKASPSRFTSGAPRGWWPASAARSASAG